MSKRQKQLDKEFEELEATGAEGKQGVEDAKKIFKKQEEDAKAEKAIQEEQLLKASRDRAKYIHFLGDLLRRGLSQVDWPSGWQARVGETDRGVVMEIETNQAKLFRTAFAATGIPGFDLNAVNNYIERAWTLMDKLTPIKKTDGLIIP